MKKLIWTACAFALGSIGSVYAEEVNFHAANPVLQSLVDSLAAGDDVIDFAYPRFDESYSNLKAEKLKYDLQGSLKNTPWLEGGHADATGTSVYFTDRSAGHTGVGTTMSASVHTNVLALIRYSAYIASRKTHDVAPKFNDRFQAHLKRLAVATSLEQVYELLVSGQRLAKEMAEYDIQKKVDWMNCLQSGQCGSTTNPAADIEYYKKAIADWKATLPSYDLVRFEVRKEGDKVRELTISQPDAGAFIPVYEKTGRFMIVPAKLSISFKDAVVSASAEAFHQMTLDKLDYFKDRLERNLVGVQNGNAEYKNEAQGKFREALIQFKKAIRGEF